MTQEKMRADFEAWYDDPESNKRALRRSDINPDGYALMQTQYSWTAWQASWQAALSTRPDAKGLVEVLAKIDKAESTVKALCNGTQKWVMCIPAQKSDPDLVISDALRSSKKALATQKPALSEAELVEIVLAAYSYPSNRYDKCKNVVTALLEAGALRVKE